jgi:hypothetical protein
MNLPQGQADEQNWIEHIEKVKDYAGTMKAYCRLHNIDYDKFTYYRSRVLNSQKMAAASNFARVQPVEKPTAAAQSAAPVVATESIAVVTKPKNYAQMPDPKWLAELIHNLAGVK